MNTRTTIAALVAILINATVFACGAIVMLAAPADGAGLTAYLLPVAMAISLFVSPVLGWVASGMLDMEAYGVTVRRRRRRSAV